MKQSIKIPIKNKIIHKKNILDIASYLEDVIIEDDGEINFKVVFKDDREISSVNKEIFNNRIFEEKEIYMISMTYIKKDYTSRIEVNIKNYDLYGYSDIKVASENENWISIVSYKIEELLSYCDSQSKFNIIFKHTYILIILVELIAVITSSSLSIFLKNILDMSITATIIPIMMLLTFINMQLFMKLEEAYPSVEISIKDKNNMAKRKRSIFIGIITITILPILINIIYDIIKRVLNI